MNCASIFGRTLGPSLAIGVAVVWAFPAGAQLLASDPLLVLTAPVDSGRRLALSLPGAPFAADWSALLGPVLRGSPDGRGGDQLVFWIAAEQRYETAFKLDATGHPELDGEMFTARTGSAGILPATSPKPGDAFWVENRGDTPAVLRLPLRLNRAPKATLALKTGLNVLGSPFAGPISPGTAGILPAYEAPSSLLPAIIPSRHSADDLALKTSFPAAEPWWEPAEEHAAPVELLRPHEDDLPAFPGAPVLTGAEVSGDRNDALLDVLAAGTLEFFHQWIDPARGFQSIGAWTLVQTLKAEAGPLRLPLPPVAVPDTARSEAPPPQSPVRLDAWIAVVRRDSDRDGASDAVEVLQNSTNPYDPANATADPDFPDGESPLAEYARRLHRATWDLYLSRRGGRVVYVDGKYGNDALDGRERAPSRSRPLVGPKRSLEAGMAEIAKTPETEVTLNIAPGVYRERLVIGAGSQRVLLDSPGGRVVLGN